MPRTNRPPKLCHHKATGQGYVLLNGKEHYLGVYGKAETEAAYNKVVGEWLANGRTLATAAAEGNGRPSSDFTITELCAAFWEHAEKYYRKPDGGVNEKGEPTYVATGEIAPMKQAVRMLKNNYGATTVNEFGPLALKAVRQKMIDAGWTRKNINRQVSRIRQIFRWGVENEVVAATTVTALEAVAPLTKGRSDAEDTEDVPPVDMEHVLAVLPYVNRHVRAMIQSQLLASMRPGEVCGMRVRDIIFNVRDEETGKTLWKYSPVYHKNTFRGKPRTIYIGQKGQDVLSPFVTTNTEAYLFSPKVAEEERNAARRAARETPMTPSQAARKSKKVTKPKGTKQHFYSVGSYRNAIRRACIKANEAMVLGLIAEGKPVPKEPLVPVWHPNQLRHTAGTAVRELFGVEAASVSLGHSKVDTTLIYAAKNEKLHRQIAAQAG